MENDDKPIGQVLSRREALKLLGLGSAAFLASCAAPDGTIATVPTGIPTQVSAVTSTALDCVVRPELTIGPYFVDDQLNRFDIRVEPSDNTLTDQVHTLEPYASKGQRDRRNSSDTIFMNGREQLLLNLQGDVTNGFTTTMNIGLDLADMEVGASDSAGGPGGGPPP